MKIHRINPCKRWSDVTVFNGIATFTEVADTDTSADIKGQVEQIFNQAVETTRIILKEIIRIINSKKRVPNEIYEYLKKNDLTTTIPDPRQFKSLGI